MDTWGHINVNMSYGYIIYSETLTVLRRLRGKAPVAANLLCGLYGKPRQLSLPVFNPFLLN